METEHWAEVEKPIYQCGRGHECVYSLQVCGAEKRFISPGMCFSRDGFPYWEVNIKYFGKRKKWKCCRLTLISLNIYISY